MWGKVSDGDGLRQPCRLQASLTYDFVADGGTLPPSPLDLSVSVQALPKPQHCPALVRSAACVYFSFGACTPQCQQQVSIICVVCCISNLLDWHVDVVGNGLRQPCRHIARTSWCRCVGDGGTVAAISLSIFSLHCMRRVFACRSSARNPFARNVYGRLPH